MGTVRERVAVTLPERYVSTVTLASLCTLSSCRYVVRALLSRTSAV